MSPLANTRRLLTSRLGRRLLLLFTACAMVPTVALVVLSYGTVTRQLAHQGNERLTALARATGKLLEDRLTLFESDLRRHALELLECPRRPDTSCGSELLYAAQAVAVVSRGEFHPVAGSQLAWEDVRAAALPRIEPGRSGFWVQGDSSGPHFHVVHRPAEPARGSELLVARLDPEYLWSSGDAERFPGRIGFGLRDSGERVLRGVVPDRATALRALLRLSPLPELDLSNWSVILSEPLDEVFAPMRTFARTFPAVIGLVLLTVVTLSSMQIRRNLDPLQELVRGTRRVASGDFGSLLRIEGHDELAQLGSAFNRMTAQLARQFQALETAASIDRAILSSVDTATIARTVLRHAPEMCRCRSVGLLVMDPEQTDAGIMWTAAVGQDDVARMPVSVTRSEREQASDHPDGLTFADRGALPGYLDPLRRLAAESDPEPDRIVACPLHHGGELLGVLALRVSTRSMTESENQELRRLAGRVAVALANARMMDRIRLLAYYDHLTRLPNRALYRERLRQEIARAFGRSEHIGVCVVDLDHFGRINDTLGHDLGDRLVQEVGARLLTICRNGRGEAAGDSPDAPPVQVARLDGDEFAVVLPELASPEEALHSSRRLLAAFREPFRLGSQEVTVTASLGLAVFPQDGESPEALHRHANLALAHAKQEGRNSLESFSSAMNQRASERLALEQELRRALDNGEFTLWYQPIVEVRTGRIAGAEALVRWNHPERGLVGPGEFIGVCEESGLIIPLGEWSLRTLCTQIGSWNRAGLASPRISVNVSARQLRQQGMVRSVQRILEETGARPAEVMLELTESLLLEQGGTTERCIQELAELGFRLAVDDFGTGYSSLSYLKHFPVSCVKIDRSFIRDLGKDPDAEAITKAIIALGRAMELEVLAEGVETPEQLAVLRSRGCHKVQGYLVGRPAPVEMFTELLATRRERRATA